MPFSSTSGTAQQVSEWGEGGGKAKEERVVEIFFGGGGGGGETAHAWAEWPRVLL